jgi:hypothetical protein
MRNATLADYKTLYASGYMDASRPWADPPLFWLLDRMPAGVLDVGGGARRFGRWMHALGMHVHSTDPAFGGPALPTIPLTLCHDYTTCFDVLEHLPEELIPAALFNLRNLSRKGCVCSLANMPDRHQIAGEDVELHLTQRGPDWWLDQFTAQFFGWEIHYRPLPYPARFWIIAEAPCTF